MSDTVFVNKETFVSTIAKDVFIADLHCAYKHDCRNVADCDRYNLLHQICKRAFITGQLYLKLKNNKV